MAGQLLRLVGGVILGLAAVLWGLATAAPEGEPKEGAPAAVREAGARLPTAKPQAVAQARGDKRRLYAATETGLFVSDDAGRRWDRLGVSPAETPDMLAIAVDPRNEGLLYVGGRAGLWQSSDAGATWKPLPTPTEARSAIRSIAVSPTVPRTFYVGTEQDGIFRSPDGGVSWMRASQGLPESSAGGRPASIRCLEVDPTNPSIAYAATELHGLYRTIDGGATWSAINRGLGPFPLQRRVGNPSLLINRTDTQQIMALLPRPLHSRSVKTFVYQSSDGGEHWFALEVELPPKALGVVLVEDPSDPRAVVVFTTMGTIRTNWRSIAGVAGPQRRP